MALKRRSRIAVDIHNNYSDVLLSGVGIDVLTIVLEQVGQLVDY